MKGSDRACGARFFRLRTLCGALRPSKVPVPSRISPGAGPASDMQSRILVSGTITSRDVLLQSVTILRLWGPRFYVRCLLAIASGRPCTFLDVLARAG